MYVSGVQCLMGKPAALLRSRVGGKNPLSLHRGDAKRRSKEHTDSQIYLLFGWFQSSSLKSFRLIKEKQ